MASETVALPLREFMRDKGRSGGQTSGLRAPVVSIAGSWATIGPSAGSGDRSRKAANNSFFVKNK